MTGTSWCNLQVEFSCLRLVRCTLAGRSEGIDSDPSVDCCYRGVRRSVGERTCDRKSIDDIAMMGVLSLGKRDFRLGTTDVRFKNRASMQGFKWKCEILTVIHDAFD